MSKYSVQNKINVTRLILKRPLKQTKAFEMRLEYVNWSHLTDLVPDRVKDHREVLQVSVQVPGGVLVVSREAAAPVSRRFAFTPHAAA